MKWSFVVWLCACWDPCEMHFTCVRSAKTMSFGANTQALLEREAHAPTLREDQLAESRKIRVPLSAKSGGHPDFISRVPPNGPRVTLCRPVSG